MELSKNTKIKTLLVIILVSFVMIFMLCFNTLALNTSYNRPWNTPTKSIEGGAVFKSEGYIKEGQYNSYLVRFNVAPIDKNTLYSHQYMTNIQAPASEAYRSFKSYASVKNANNESILLNDALEFDIPVYLNMADKYEYPLPNNYPYNSLPTQEQQEKYPEFLKYLEEQGFPKLYWKDLCTLHEKYPNWIFKAIITNLDFNASVDAELPNSYVSDLRFADTSKGMTNEYGWYYASKKTVAYYMDPRNMLDEDGIMMFNSLKFNYNVSKESYIAGIENALSSSFMNSVEKISGKRYSEIFYEAGKKSDVDPIYLASLSVQEVNVSLGNGQYTGSVAVTGEKQLYNGIVYMGLYNFFNIGAYSSADNPALEGLVYANGGANLSNNAFVPGTEPSEITPPNDSDNSNNGNNTGDKSYLPGDVNGDGSVNTRDYIAIEKHIMGIKTLTGDSAVRADVSGDGAINTRDYIAIEKHIMGIKKLF